jgi:hypothetical protein
MFPTKRLGESISSSQQIPHTHHGRSSWNEGSRPQDDGSRGLATRQYARLVQEWVANIGLDPSKFGTHSLRRYAES